MTVVDQARDLRNAVVLGCPRSGTSVVTALVASASHQAGDRLLPPDSDNPKGYFEDLSTLAINERLLEPYAGSMLLAAPDHDRVYDQPLSEGDRWMAALAPEVCVWGTPDWHPAMRRALGTSPWCRKDPRFCYTLTAWQPIIGDAVRICLFREPARSAASIVTWAQKRAIGLGYDAALRIWNAMYWHVLIRHRFVGEWLFVHYDQVLDGTAIPKLEDAVGAGLDQRIPDPALNRSPIGGTVPAHVDQTYRLLCRLAAHRL